MSTEAAATRVLARREVHAWLQCKLEGGYLPDPRQSDAAGPMSEDREDRGWRLLHDFRPGRSYEIEDEWPLRLVVDKERDIWADKGDPLPLLRDWAPRDGETDEEMTNRYAEVLSRVLNSPPTREDALPQAPEVEDAQTCQRDRRRRRRSRLSRRSIRVESSRVESGRDRFDSPSGATPSVARDGLRSNSPRTWARTGGGTSGGGRPRR